MRAISRRIKQIIFSPSVNVSQILPKSEKKGEKKVSSVFMFIYVLSISWLIAICIAILSHGEVSPGCQLKADGFMSIKEVCDE